VCGLVLVVFAFPCWAETIIVDPNGSGDFTNIQDAIDYSWDGDTVILKPGIYYENIFFNTRAITITGVEPNDPNIVATTVIEGTVTFDFYEGEDSVLRGTTVAKYGVVCYDTSPTLTQNRIVECQNALSCYIGSSPSVRNNTFLNNYTAIMGCGGSISDNSFESNGGRIESCTGSIVNNRMTNISINYCSETIADNNIVGFLSGCSGVIRNNRIQATGVALSSCGGTIIDNTIIGQTGLSDCDGTIRHNTISGAILYGMVNCTGIITDNAISGTPDYGLYGCIGTIAGNTIYGANKCGLIYCSGIITSNTVLQALTGMRHCSGTIASNIVKNGNFGISNCNGQIQGNTVSLYGTGFDNCDATFLNNIVTANGSGFSSCRGTISNNTITGNYNCAIAGCNYNTVVKNNIIAFNQVGIEGDCSNSYNCFWKNTGGNFAGGAYGKTGDFFADPKFAQNGVWSDDFWQEGDYHLKSSAGRYDPNTQTWIMDDVNSPCIDKGDPNDSTGYEANPNGGRINVGNFGGTAEASKSSNGSGPEPPEPPTTCTSPIKGDLNDDCKVDFVDFALMAGNWLKCNLDPPSACWQ
jgi:hypothetical protein